MRGQRSYYLAPYNLRVTLRLRLALSVTLSLLLWGCGGVRPTQPSTEAGPIKEQQRRGEGAQESKQEPTPTQADQPARGAAPRTGFSMNLGAALMTCLPNGKANCKNTYPGPSLSAAMEVRFWYLGIAVEYDHGWHIVGGDGSEEVSSTTSHVTPVLKGYYPLEELELFLGFGLGYSSLSVYERSSDSLASWSTIWQGAKLTGGAWYDLTHWGMPEGFTLDIIANLFLNSDGVRCTEYAGSGPCLSGNDLTPTQRDVVNHLHLGTALRYTF